jgi:signal transduction histidine kinase
MRERRKAQDSTPILYERADWKLFFDPQTLPQKAGCEPNQLGRVVIKELVDNALDSGADKVELSGDERHCSVVDNGPGLAAKDMPRVLRSIARWSPRSSNGFRPVACSATGCGLSWGRLQRSTAPSS